MHKTMHYNKIFSVGDLPNFILLFHGTTGFTPSASVENNLIEHACFRGYCNLANGVNSVLMTAAG